MSSSKKLTCRGTLWQVFLSEAPSPPKPHTPPPPYTLYTCILYTYSHREGGGRLEGHQFTRLGKKYQHD
jgi:hypothetical protein